MDFIEISKQYMEFMTTHSSDVFFILNEKLEFVYLSPSVFKLRGVTVEDAMLEKQEDHFTPNSLKIIDMIYGEYFPLIDPKIPNQCFTKRVYLELKKKPSGTVHVESTIKMVIKYGTVEYVCGLTRDMTDVFETNRLVGILQMAGATCHEFSQPIHVISGAIDLLEHELEQCGKVKNNITKYINMIRNQLKRTEALLHKSRSIMNNEPIKNKDFGIGKTMKIIDLS